MTFANTALALLVLLASSIPARGADGPQPKLPDGAERAAESITAEALAAPIRFLSSDLLEGRGPASQGDELTRLYLASRLEELGLRPGGPEGKWEQPFDIVGIETVAPPTWSFRAGGAEVALKRRQEFVATSGIQAEAASLREAEIVFAGFGIQAPQFGWDDFKGTDLRGKVLLLLNNDPDWDPALFEGKRRLYYGRWTYKYESAARQGAAGAVIIHTTPSAGYPWQVVQTSWSGEQFELPEEGEPRVPVQAWIAEDAVKKLLAAAGHDLERLVGSARRRDFRPVPLRITTSLSLQNKLRRVKTANVLGLLPGSDPVLKDQAVVYTAHHDHLGVGEPDAKGDRVYNGAMDNASGVAQALSIARAFKALPQPPRRSVLFLFVAAEEQGLLGSAHYTRRPTFRPGRIAANLNFDGANIWGRTRDVCLIGKGKSALDGIAEALAARQDRVVRGEEFPDRGFYYRSDQFNFAKVGVPALYIETGTDFRGRPEGWGRKAIEEWEATRYHQPSDELGEWWNFEGMVEDAKLGFLAGLAIAEADAMPAWTPGDEFEPARKKALEEARAATCFPAEGAGLRARLTHPRLTHRIQESTPMSKKGGVTCDTLAS